MSGLVITIPIIQHVINAIVSEETEITPRKIVELLGENYDEDSDYIFEIKENITIHTGKTLKGFENIVVKPETEDVTINNGGTIEDCIITLNTNDNGNYCSIISNGYVDGDNNFEGNINNCTITLNENSDFYNGNGGIGNITGGSITLNDNNDFFNGNENKGYINSCNITLNVDSDFYNGKYNEGNINSCNITLNIDSDFFNGNYNEGNINNCTITLNEISDFYNGNCDVGNITGCFITLEDNSEFYNDSYTLNNCIFINGSAKLYNFYNYKDYIGNIIATKYGTLKDNYIFADDTSIIQNSYDNTPGVFNNTYLRFSDSSNIDITEYQSLPADSFTLGKTIMSYLNKQFSELKKATTDKDNSLASQISELSTRVGGLESTTSLEVNEIALQIEGLSKDIEELVKRIQILFYNLPNDMSEQLVNKSSDSIQKLLLLLLLNKSDNDLTSNIKRLLKQ